MFAWMGSTRPLDAFTFIFQETEWGPFIAHAYQYEMGRSTWIFETDPETFERAGLQGLSEKQSADRMAGIFGWFLEGHQLLTNRSMWRNFPMIRSKRWVKDNMVLLGDAKATAHFSIGSGTKLAMEDAIALADAMHRAPTVDAALQQYEAGPPRGGREDPARRRRVAGLVRACRPLLGFRSRAVRVRRHDAGQGDHLRQSDAAGAGFRRARSTRPLRKQVRASGLDVDVEKPVAPMFQPLRLREMTARQSRGGVADVHVFGARRACPAISIWCITARAPSAAPG